MSSSVPASPAPVPARRRIWPWVLAVVCAPFLFLAVAAYGFVTLNQDAAVLRTHVMRATNANWDTKVQVSVGRMSFALVRSCLAFVKHDKIDEARLALASVRSASVGVYQLHDRSAEWSRAAVLNAADAVMARRGWTRMVGVAGKGDTVMVYVPEDTDELEKICVAVVNNREMVVVSAELKPAALVQLLEKVSDGKLHRPCITSLSSSSKPAWLSEVTSSNR